jgi:intracellular multiplication protein IcmO
VESGEKVLEVEEPIEPGHMNIFQKVTLNDRVKRLTGSDFDRFSQPLITKAFLKDKVDLLERVLGRSGSQAQNIANEIIKDMQIATDYPPDVEGIFLEPDSVVAAARELVEYVTTLRTPSE